MGSLDEFVDNSLAHFADEDVVRVGVLRKVRRQQQADVVGTGALVPDLDVHQAAAVLHLSASAVRTLIRTGALAGYMLGNKYLVAPAVLHAYQDAVRGKAGKPQPDPRVPDLTERWARIRKGAA